jgi:hypothetical protein
MDRNAEADQMWCLAGGVRGAVDRSGELLEAPWRDAGRPRPIPSPTPSTAEGIATPLGRSRLASRVPSWARPRAPTMYFVAMVGSGGRSHWGTGAGRSERSGIQRCRDRLWESRGRPEGARIRVRCGSGRGAGWWRGCQGWVPENGFGRACRSMETTGRLLTASEVAERLDGLHGAVRVEARSRWRAASCRGASTSGSPSRTWSGSCVKVVNRRRRISRRLARGAIAVAAAVLRWTPREALCGGSLGLAQQVSNQLARLPASGLR